MENNTKVYVVKTSMMSIFGGSSVNCVFLSKSDAEFYVWLKNRENSGIGSVYMSSYYSVTQTTVKSIDKSGKDYTKFIKEKLGEIEGEIKKKEECSEKDMQAIRDLNEQKNFYSTLDK